MKTLQSISNHPSCQIIWIKLVDFVQNFNFSTFEKNEKDQETLLILKDKYDEC